MPVSEIHRYDNSALYAGFCEAALQSQTRCLFLNSFTSAAVVDASIIVAPRGSSSFCSRSRLWRYIQVHRRMLGMRGSEAPSIHRLSIAAKPVRALSVRLRGTSGNILRFALLLSSIRPPSLSANEGETVGVA